MKDVLAQLKQAGIQPSAQRMAIAEYVLSTEDHPAADDVWREVRVSFPMVSRATVYNTLNLFVEKGLLRTQTLTGGRIVFDSNMRKHHHFIDEQTGEIEDIPWEAIQVSPKDHLDQFQVSEYQVIVRGRRKQAEEPG